jgi:hypothetical protein
VWTEPPVPDSALADVSAEHRLDVDDGHPIQCFEMAHLHSSTMYGADFQPVQADGIGALRRAGTEDALRNSRSVPPRVHAQNVGTGAVKPGEDDDSIARADAPETLKHIRLENQPGLGCAFVGLPGCRFQIGQGRLDPSDRFHLKTRHVPLLGIKVTA